MDRGIRLLRVNGLLYVGLLAPSLSPLGIAPGGDFLLARGGSVISYEYPKLSKKLGFSYITRKAQTIYLLELNSSDGSDIIFRTRTSNTYAFYQVKR